MPRSAASPRRRWRPARRWHCRSRPARGFLSSDLRARRAITMASSTGLSLSPRNTASACACVTSAAEIGDRDTCAAASDGASLRPSPTISTRRPLAFSASMQRNLVGRFQAALPMLDAESACDRRDCLGAVAGENAQIEPAPAQRIRLPRLHPAAASGAIANGARTLVRVAETDERRCLASSLRCDHAAELRTAEPRFDAVNDAHARPARALPRHRRKARASRLRATVPPRADAGSTGPAAPPFATTPDRTPQR